MSVRVFDGHGPAGNWTEYDPSRASPQLSSPDGPPLRDHPVDGEFIMDVPFIKDVYEEVYFN